jgi:hypothetical protein
MLRIMSEHEPMTIAEFQQLIRDRYFSTDSEADFSVAPLEIRSIFPQELPLLLSRGGLELVERFGDWSGGPFAVDAPLQLCICE